MYYDFLFCKLRRLFLILCITFGIYNISKKKLLKLLKKFAILLKLFNTFLKAKVFLKVKSIYIYNTKTMDPKKHDLKHVSFLLLYHI